MREWGASLPVITAPAPASTHAKERESGRRRERARDVGGGRREGGREGGRKGLREGRGEEGKRTVGRERDTQEGVEEFVGHFGAFASRGKETRPKP